MWERSCNRHVWAYIARVWHNAFHPMKGDLREGKWRGGACWDWTEVMPGVPGPSEPGEQWQPATPQLDAECRPGHLVTSGSLVGQASQTFTVGGFIPRGSGLRLPSTPWGPHRNSKYIHQESPRYSPPYSSILFKTFLVKFRKTLQGDTKSDY